MWDHKQNTDDTGKLIHRMYNQHYNIDYFHLKYK